MKTTDEKYSQDWHSIFVYDERSPSGLIWKNDRFRGRKNSQKFISAGDTVGSLNKLDGYWHVHVFDTMYNVQNIIWAMFGRKQGDMLLDHEDGDRSNNKISNIRLVSYAQNAKNLKKRISNKSGVTGVCRRDVKSRHGEGKKNSYWIAQWKDLNKKVCSKNFSIAEHGEQEAFRLACEYRAKMIEELNAQGAGYTDRHGI